MANDGFNGTTATWEAAALGNGILAVRYQETGGNADTTESSDSAHTYEQGIVDLETTVEFLGTDAVAKGDKGALVIGWFDGTSVGSIANAICTSVSYGGQMDGALTGSATFKPSTA